MNAELENRSMFKHSGLFGFISTPVFLKWEAMMDDINTVFGEDNRKNRRINNKDFIVNQCNQKLAEYKDELSDMQARKLEELKIHVVQKKYDMEEQVTVLESERDNTGLFKGFRKKKIDREIDKLILQIKMYEKPSSLVRGHQYIENLLLKSRKNYASVLNTYLMVVSKVYENPD